MRPTTFIALGTLLIAVGGLIATYGWSMNSSEDTRRMLVESRSAELNRQRDALLRALAIETIANLGAARSPALHPAPNIKSEGYAPLPRFDTAAMDAVLSSGAFAEPEHRDFYVRVFNTRSRAAAWNERLRSLEQLMLAGHAASVQKALADQNAFVPLEADFVALQADIRTRGIEPASALK